MATNNRIPSREQLLRGQQTGYTAPRTQAQTQNTTKLVTAPEDAPAMTAREVQQVVNNNAGQQQAAAQNAATALPVTGAGVTGMGRYGSGQWYNAIGPGGKVADQAAFLAAAPGAYNSPYAAAMQQNLNQLLNPEGFRYDVNADGLYQQIKDNYIRQGRQAMMDTQGQAAGLTGGYGNSYGAMAGQQAYQESLGSLAGMIPELQQLAWSQYQAEQDARRNNLEALHKLDADEYARWQDEQKAYQEELAKLPAASHQTMLGGGGGPTIVVPGAGGAAAGQFAVDPVMQDALRQYFADGNGTVQDALKLRSQGYHYKDVPDAQIDYFLNRNLGLYTGNPGQLGYSFSNPSGVKVKGGTTAEQAAQNMAEVEKKKGNKKPWEVHYDTMNNNGKTNSGT